MGQGALLAFLIFSGAGRVSGFHFACHKPERKMSIFMGHWWDTESKKTRNNEKNPKQYLIDFIDIHCCG